MPRIPLSPPNGAHSFIALLRGRGVQIIRTGPEEFRWESLSSYAQAGARSRFPGMTLRKRHKIVLLFWVPFWSLTLGFCALAGWMTGIWHF